MNQRRDGDCQKILSVLDTDNAMSGNYNWNFV